MIDPARLSPADAARLLGVSVRTVRADLKAGLPANPDGTVSLISYAAWLNLQLCPDPDDAED